MARLDIIDRKMGTPCAPEYWIRSSHGDFRAFNHADAIFLREALSSLTNAQIGHAAGVAVEETEDA